MKPVLRCAVYTRKSSDEGLEQEFNSLDAQREACLAYVQSQKGEGWTATTRRYDDGGWSGGSMERPGLQRLLADIAAGLVNVVVVYKVDRLTRSLADFARIVDTFDRNGVSFVSVTQAFNTTTSMGRLTLNVLLSFAQFEREVTGERIRDKIAASKAKGMWMGGTPPLGYAPRERTLDVVPHEAETVRQIFRRYIELGSVHVLARELAEHGIRSKRWTTSKGEARGGVVLSRGALFHMLRNRLYLGQIVHKGASHPGQHAAIVDPDTFAAAGRLLDAAPARKASRAADTAPLTGLLFDAAGNLMTPVHSRGRSGGKYRYYVSAPLQSGRDVPADIIRRIPALRIEELVLMRLREWSRRAEADWTSFTPLLRRIDVHSAALVLTVAPPAHERWADRLEHPASLESAAGGLLLVTIPATIILRGGRSRVTGGGVIRINPDRALIGGLRRAHAELAARGIALLDRAPHFSDARGIDDPYIRSLSSAAFLAPDIQHAILTGRQPDGMTLAELLRSDIPLCWDRQRVMLGIGQGRS
jgi:DNA invertase Pin-like site-specific DNA recombinase